MSAVSFVNISCTYRKQNDNGCTVEVRLLPPLVSVQEIEKLREQLGEVAEGKRFLLQGGDCAETFKDCNPSQIEKKLRIMLQMSLVVSCYGSFTVAH